MSSLVIRSDVRSPNHGAREPRTDIDMLVLHYTGMRSGREAQDRLCDPAFEVSAHYLVHEDGTVLHLVDEDRRAWHAGIAYWRGATDINNRSIGIEIVNPGHEFGYRPFPGPQMKSVVLLCQDILRRHPIPLRNVVGHSDVAPWRKEDPGELFDWKGLAAEGVGLWPGQTVQGESDTDDEAHLLADIGYRVTEPSSVPYALLAFQRRFRPKGLTGVADAGTRHLLRAVRSVMCQSSADVVNRKA